MLRIENNMSMLRTNEMTADRAQAARAQSANPAVMEHEQKKLREDEAQRPQLVEEVEYARVEENKREDRQQQQDRRREAPEEAEAEDDLPEDEKELLRKEAAERLLMLPVECGKFAQREERRIDLLL